MHAKVQDPDVQPLTMTAWRDRLLQEPSAWKKVKLPRADGACVQAGALRVQASQQKEHGRQLGATRWLLIEELGDGTFREFKIKSWPIPWIHVCHQTHLYPEQSNLLGYFVWGRGSQNGYKFI